MEEDQRQRVESRLFTYFMAAVAVGLVLLLVQYPGTAFQAAIKGLKIWWDVVFPALLPFFIGAQLLMGLGVVHLMGVILEPLMRPLFRLPGEGAFVVAMGLSSGYPIGAVLTAKLRKQELISRTEAERLVSFANTADPLFMSGAVAVGMFKNPALGGLIMIAHYLGALGTGLLLRFYKGGEPVTPRQESDQNIWQRGLEALEQARAEDGRPVGKLLGDCVMDSINTLLLVGGFVILFSVLIQVLTTTGLVPWLSRLFAWLLGLFGLDPTLAPGLVSGFFEISLGSQALSAAHAPLAQKLAVIGTVIAWSGLSVHAQVAAVIQDTDMSIAPYIVSRVIHGVLAAAITLLLWRPGVQQAGQTVMAPLVSSISHPAAEVGWVSWVSKLGWSLEWFALVGLACLLGSLIYALRRALAPVRSIR